ncbi:MAG: branched-chain amino acid ABC transporter permease, partial [Spirochaetales bacterium]|nr:branched-chain amino acid ABC transporter permease [Spirochaetales bacterium]
LLGMIILINLINSRVGRSLRALHGSEEAANAMGVNTARLKLNVFVVGALFASVAGILLTHYNRGIGPSEASTLKSVRYVAIVAVGGMANLWGTLTISVVLNFLSLRGIFGSYDDAVFGTVLIAIMLFAPDGFLKISILNDIRNWIRQFARAKRRARFLFRKTAAKPANPLKSNGEGT